MSIPRLLKWHSGRAVGGLACDVADSAVPLYRHNLAIEGTDKTEIVSRRLSMSRMKLLAATLS
jgi:hypothetical protein